MNSLKVTHFIGAWLVCAFILSCTNHSGRSNGYLSGADISEIRSVHPIAYKASDEASVFRFFDPFTGEHFFTINSREGHTGRYISQGVGFTVFKNSFAGSVGLYRCHDDARHFVSLDPACENKKVEGFYGSIFSSPSEGTLPLYRLFSPLNDDHFITTELSETLTPGYLVEAILGYVPIGTLGQVDGVISQDSSYHIQGWSCEYGVSKSIQVQIYRVGAIGTGALIGTYETQNSSGAEIANSCGDPSTTAHRFDVTIDEALISRFHTQELFVQPISSNGAIGNPLSHSGPLKIPGRGGISFDYQMPRSKQGITDFREGDTDVVTNMRYAKFKEMNLGYRTYNYFWSGLEDSKIISSAFEVHCPSNYLQVPRDENEMNAFGYHRYRCISKALVAQHDRLLLRDEQNGLQSAIVFWSAPVLYRDPNCTGGPWVNAILKDGCAPRDDAMDDFEDVINFLARHYDGKHGVGKISHFVIWNEASNALWFDNSPTISNRGILSAHDVDRLVTKYADMLLRAHRAIQKSASGVMLYASLDGFWTKPRTDSDSFSEIGSKRLVDGLWEKLGVNINWSLVVHPYGDVKDQPQDGSYSFQNLEIISQYQQQQLKSRSLPTDSLEFPQGFLLANEQGWPQAIGTERQAINICFAFQKSLELPNYIGQAHNYFQSVETQDATPGGVSDQGMFLGLLPSSSKIDLSDMDQYSTGRAYLSTNPEIWGKSSSHFCCEVAGLGCDANKKLALDYTSADEENIYRYYHVATGEHFFTRDLAEGQFTGFKPEGVGFKVLHDANSNRHKIYRCRSGSKHFISLDANCENQNVESLYGYLFNEFVAGTLPVYRFNASIGIDHIATINFAEGISAGYTFESILGYAPIFSLGSIEGITARGSSYVIQGWSCEYKVAVSTRVRVYRLDPMQGQVLVGTFSANEESEASINQTCGEGSAHRFAITIDPSIVLQSHGQIISVQPISSAGLIGNRLANSGNFRIP